MNLLETMERLRCKHTRGAEGPVLFLLHKEDLAYLDDRTAEEREKSRYFPGPFIYFRGIRCIESEFAEKGSPMVVLR